MIDFDKLALGPCMTTFAEPARWQSGRLGDWVAMTGVYDDAYYPLDPLGGDDGMGGVHVTTSRPVLGIQLSALAVEPDQGDLIEMRGKMYRIHEVQPDGRGGALLILNDATGENDALPGDYP